MGERSSRIRIGRCDDAACPLAAFSVTRRRVERLNAQIQREISEIIRTQLRDPRVATATVAGVEMTGDLSLARVFIRALGSSEEREVVLEGLAAATPFIRRSLGRELSMRRVPELQFKPDRSLDGALRIEQILTDVRPAEGWEDEADEGEGDPEVKE